MIYYSKKEILKKFIYITLILIFIVSCDYMYDYTYEVTNNSDSNIKIKLKTFNLDSVFNVNQNEIKILFITHHQVEGSDGPYFKDVSFDLANFIVSKNDTIFSKKDYLNNSSWQYDNGFYRTTITNEEF